VIRTSSPPVFIDFINRDYHYKSVATQISHDAKVNTGPRHWPKSLPIGDRTIVTSHSTSNKDPRFKPRDQGTGTSHVLIWVIKK
jgi:hypothetical protein